MTFFYAYVRVLVRWIYHGGKKASRHAEGFFFSKKKKKKRKTNLQLYLSG